MSSQAFNSARNHLRLVPSEGDAARSARHSAIEKYKILDTLPEASYDSLTALAAMICGTPFAAISFIDEDRQWFKAAYGIRVCETPAAESFCAHVIRRSELCVVPDARVHPSFRDLPSVTGAPYLRFYAGMPLRASDGTIMATLCVFSPDPRPGGVTATERETLEVLGRQVETQLELRRAIIDRDRHAIEQRAMSQKLWWTADHDPLTGLPNRAAFHARLERAIQASRADETSIVTLVIDLDHFKQVNEQLGHHGGDAILCACAARLRDIARDQDMVARFGGDEFALLLPDIGDNEEVSAVVRSISGHLRAPYLYEGRAIDCRASIGIAVYPDHALDPEMLIRRADLALGSAKTAGRDRTTTFRPEMAELVQRQKMMLTHARVAIDRDQIAPFYQPKIDLMTGGLVGFEALLRWEHSKGEITLPSAIDSAFSDRELAPVISERMTGRVLQDMRGWLDAGVPFGHVGINASASDFAGNSFAECLLAALEASGVPPTLIQVEVTEGVFLGPGSHHVQRAMALLNKHGVDVALDDFGTGFASLTHLKQFPVDILKIDRSFVAGLGWNIDDAAIVRAVATLGAGLGVQTVAEGVETVEQADFVRACGCGQAQGFLFGAARPARDIPAWVAEMARTAMQG